MLKVQHVGMLPGTNDTTHTIMAQWALRVASLQLKQQKKTH